MLGEINLNEISARIFKQAESVALAAAAAASAVSCHGRLSLRVLFVNVLSANRDERSCIPVTPCDALKDRKSVV